MGDLTPHLYKLQKDDTLLCRKIAKDRFTLDVKSGRMQHLLMPGNHKPYCLLGASRSWEFGYREELERIQGKCHGSSS
jgi:hypothetical protein